MPRQCKKCLLLEQEIGELRTQMRRQRSLFDKMLRATIRTKGIKVKDTGHLVPSGAGPLIRKDSECGVI